MAFSLSTQSLFMVWVQVRKEWSHKGAGKYFSFSLNEPCFQVYNDGWTHWYFSSSQLRSFSLLPYNSRVNTGRKVGKCFTVKQLTGRLLKWRFVLRSKSGRMPNRQRTREARMKLVITSQKAETSPGDWQETEVEKRQDWQQVVSPKVCAWESCITQGDNLAQSRGRAELM